MRWIISQLLVARGHIQAPPITDDLDVYVVVAELSRVNVNPACLSECQEGTEAKQVDRGDEGKHRSPWACRLNEIPREVHH